MKMLFILGVILTIGADLHAFSRDGDADDEYQRATSRGAKTKLELHVVDDEGLPVSNVDVEVVFAIGADFQSGFFKTDAEGLAVVEGVTTGNTIEFFLKKESYYNSYLKLRYLKFGENRKVEDGKWQPWGEHREIRLRKIRNPVLHGNQYKALRSPMTNVWIGVDLKVADWVRPFGCGERADFELRVRWDGLPPDRSKLCCYDLRVCGSNDGFYLSKKILESEYKEAFVADVRQSYTQRMLDYTYHRMILASPPKEFWADQEAIFRVRTELDYGGNVISANYGSVRCCKVSPGTRGRGALIEFCSVFNPTPNDPNLEDDEIAQRTYKQIELEKRLEKERREKEAKTVWGGIKKMFGAP